MAAMPTVSAVSRSNSANRDGDGENDGKECFHRTKVSLPLARVRVRDGLRNRGSFITLLIPAGSTTDLAGESHLPGNSCACSYTPDPHERLLKPNRDRSG
jgi:hypothetical protein